MASIASIEKDTIYHIDETGSSQEKHTYRGYSPKGERCYSREKGARSPSISIVAGCNKNKLIEPMSIIGAFNSLYFNAWFLEKFLPTILPKSTIVMDNARIHNKDYLRALAAQFDCIVIFLPPYSPDLNPIEHIWGTVKNLMRRLMTYFKHSFEEALEIAFKKYTYTSEIRISS